MNFTRLVDRVTTAVIAELLDETGVEFAPEDFRSNCRERLYMIGKRRLALRLHATGLMTHEAIGAVMGRDQSTIHFYLSTEAVLA